MLATAARTLTKRLIASPPFPALPTGALALKVTKLAGRRYFFVYILLLRGETAGECCSYAFSWAHTMWDNTENRISSPPRTRPPDERAGHRIAARQIVVGYDEPGYLRTTLHESVELAQV